jgi:hypothetical protein
MPRRTVCPILAFTALLACAPQANADVITIFNNRTLFNALADPNMLMTFDSYEFLPDSYYTHPDGSVMPLHCILTCDVRVDDALVLATTYAYPASFGDGNVIFNAGSAVFSSIFYPSPSMTAIGFDLDGTGLFSFRLGSSYSSTNLIGYLTVTSPTFFGFISDSPFEFFGLQALPLEDPFDPSKWQPTTLDNLAVRTVPEPSTIALLIVGLVALAVYKRGRLDDSCAASSKL